MTDEIGTEQEELETSEVAETEEAPAKAESAEETARAVWEELAAKADETEESPEEPTEEPNEITKAARKLASARKKKRQTFVPAESVEAPTEAAAEAPVTEKYEPPADWDVGTKEWFLSQPPQLQKQYLEREKNLKAQSTKHWQNWSRETEAAKEISEVTSRYLKDKRLPPGMTPARVIEQLFDYQKRINEDSIGAIADMIRFRKVSLEDIEARLNGTTSAPQRAALQQETTSNYLTPEEFERRLNEREARLAQHRDVEAATEEVRALQRELQNGKYVWPEMHEPQTIQRIQDLVTYFRKTTPGISWQDSYKRAILQDRANRGNPSPTSPRLTPEEIQNVRQASSSLRSRGGNGAIPRLAEPKANETARESAEAAYYAIFGNKQH